MLPVPGKLKPTWNYFVVAKTRMRDEAKKM
jgi:hypothetical protein